LTPDRQDTLRRSFTDLPEVVLRFYQPPMAALTTPDSQGPNPPRNNSPGGLTALQLQFERSLGGAEAFEHFANELLETSQGAMGRAHALARLAQHFPPDVEAKLTKEDDEVLVRLRRDHVQGMSQNVKYIVRRMAAVLDAGVIGRQPIERAPEPATWWEASRNLLAATRQMDHFLTLLLTGAADDSSGHLLTDAERALWVVDAEVSRSEGIIAGAPEGRR
jgi:hypothetical protein